MLDGSELLCTGCVFTRAIHPAACDDIPFASSSSLESIYRVKTIKMTHKWECKEPIRGLVGVLFSVQAGTRCDGEVLRSLV
jgi:hypothetical protein